ncbi:endonuclease MutS2 [Halocola ammonii]
MKNFDQRVSNDLEFDVIRLMLHDFCIGETARLRMVDLSPIDSFRALDKELQRSKEFHRIRIEGETFPALDFEELKDEIRLLEVRDSALSEESFLNILRASLLGNDIVQFFKGRQEDFPLLCELAGRIRYTKDLTVPIEKVFDKRGKIKDTASPKLNEIRKDIGNVKRQINQNFDKEVKKLQRQGFLSDMKEAYLSNRRVLSVESSHKRKISGNVLGSSKTGSLTYIEPQSNIGPNNELEMLYDDERKEIFRILKELTAEMSQHLDLIIGYQEVLTELDFTNAKIKLALELDADLPAIGDQPHIELIDAFHPVLLLNNRKSGLKTEPQSLKMDKFSRMLVISGPNAGGKSITLKTVGLLQVMLQSGLLVPVNSNSKMSFFQQVLTDIGDNQSIENQLSTYSYRLKRMKHFLEVSNRRTLLLLDEFGTGSDPELGGALAEVFFEALYNKKSFGVITTHYSNIKLKAANLKNAMNGCMLFDRESLEPTYKLSVGQPGSSFTFEVAQINGIPMELIEKAKENLKDSTVLMDKLLSDLQKDKSRMQSLKTELEEAKAAAREAKSSFEKRKKRLDEKHEVQQKMIERNNKYLHKGKKMDQFIQEYTKPGNTKQTLTEVKKFLAMEKAKIEEEKKKARLKKQTTKPKKAKKREKNIAKIVVGSLVKLRDSKQTGEVIQLDGKSATVAFGNFKTKVETQKLIFVK